MYRVKSLLLLVAACVCSARAVDGIAVNCNQTVFTNWIDEQAISLGKKRCAGDFWIQPPAGKVGMVETIEGTWIGEVATAVGKVCEPSARQNKLSECSRKTSIRENAAASVNLSTLKGLVDIRGREIRNLQ